MYSSLICGLNNIGNTCYMNAIIQLIVHNEHIYEFLTSENITSDSDTMIYQIKNLIRLMGNNDTIVPLDFKKTISKQQEIFRGYSQNDAHELLVLVLDRIHEETKSSVVIKEYPIEYIEFEKFKKNIQIQIDNASLLRDKIKLSKIFDKYISTHMKEYIYHKNIGMWGNYIKNNYSIISHHFTGLFHNIIFCNNCHNVSHSHEIFNCLTVDIDNDDITKNLSLFDCIYNYIRPTTNMEDFKCSDCNKTGSCKKKTSIWHLPNTLFIHLKRFKQSYRHGNVCVEKATNFIDIPLSFNPIDFLSEYNQTPSTYVLKSVIHHYGSINSGHYVSFVNIDNKWYQFNDSHVSVIENIDTILTKDIYIVVYNKK